ncbi:phosphatidylglycerophosphatase A [candidate division KSB1 bacterium]
MHDPEKRINRLFLLVGSGFFTGYSPYAPGTAGSILCIVILWFIPPLSVITYVIITFGVIALGVLSASHLNTIYGEDSHIITIDEIAGMIISLIALPKSFSIWLLAFAFFRLFDIFKPPPIKTLEYLPGGFGVMADDIAAGIYANLCCQIIIWIL